MLKTRLESPGRGGLGLFDQGLDPDDFAFRRVGVECADYKTTGSRFGPKHSQARQPRFPSAELRPKPKGKSTPPRVRFQVVVKLRILRSAHLFDRNQGLITPARREFDMATLPTIRTARQKSARLGKLVPGGGKNLMQFEVSLVPGNGMA